MDVNRIPTATEGGRVAEASGLTGKRGLQNFGPWMSRTH